MADILAALVFTAALIAVLGVGGLTIVPALPRMAALLRNAGRGDAAGMTGRTLEPAALVCASHAFLRHNRLISGPLISGPLSSGPMVTKALAT